jgi:hypothetical protein
MNNASNNCLAPVAFSSAFIYSDMVCKKTLHLSGSEKGASKKWILLANRLKN